MKAKHSGMRAGWARNIAMACAIPVLLAGCGERSGVSGGAAAAVEADAAQIEAKARPTKPTNKIPTAQGFVIDEFAVVVVSDALREVTNNVLGGVEEAAPPVTIEYDAAFSMDCVPLSRPRKGQVCSNTRPDFNLDIYVSNGGVELLVMRQAVTGSQINYRGVAGFDGMVVRQSVIINAPLLQTLLAQRGTEPLQLRAEAQVLPSPDSTTYPTLATLGPHLWPMFAGLDFGDVRSALTELSVGANCGTNSWVVSGSGSVGPSDFEFGELCVAVDTSDPLLTVLSGSVNLGSVTTSAGAFGATLGNVTLDSTGASAASVSVDLPDSVLAHTGASFRALGVKQLQLTSSSLDGELRVTNGAVSTPVWFSSEGLPVIVRVDALSLDATGLKGAGAAAAYLHRQRPFSPSDSRQVPLKRQDLVMDTPARGRYLHSNDILFSQPGVGSVVSGGVAQVMVSPDGLNVTGLKFGEGSGGGHFPLASRNWSGFAADIAQGRLLARADSMGADQRLRVFPSTGCGECPQPTAPGAPVPSAMGIALDEVGLDASGALAGRGSLNRGPTWGPRTQTGERVFARDDQNGIAVVYAPGYWLDDSATSMSLADHLLGSRELTQNGSGLALGASHTATSAQALAGNHFFAGINVGPQWLRDGSLQPVVGAGADLQGTKTQVRIGNLQAPASVELNSNVATKYVQRAGGITGVFQGRSSEQATVYGYPFEFSRFGFRTVRNQLDSYTWIDGAVAVPPPAKLDVAFRSLALQCDGSIDGGVVEPGLCEGPNPGPNCDLVLAAWQSKTEVLGMRFVPKDDQLSACAVQDRVLALDQTVQVNALDRKLGLTAEWTAEGQMRDAALRGSTHARFERVGSEDGFRVAFGREGISMPVGSGNASSEAWFQFDEVSMGVPFWEHLTPRMRLGNKTLDAAMPSVLAGNGFSASSTNLALAQSALTQTAMDSTARYQWGATPFVLTPNVYYRSVFLPGPAASDGPQWLGRTYTEDLYVVDLNAGVDYIRPEFTRVSFGASADFARLRDLNLDLNVDLLDPASVQQIDAWFNRYFSVQPFGATLSPLTRYMDPLAEFTGPKLEELTESLLNYGLDQAITATFGLSDPFRLLAGYMGEIQSLPATVVDQVVAPIRNQVDGLEKELGDGVEQAFLSSVGELATGAATINAKLDELQQAVAAGDQRRQDELRAEIAAIRDDLLAALEDLESGVLGPIAQAKREVKEVQNIASDQIESIERLRDEFGVGAAVGVIDDARVIVDKIHGMIVALVPDQTCGFNDPIAAFSAPALFSPTTVPPISVPNWGTADFDFSLQSPQFGKLPSVDPNAFTRPIAAVGQTMQNLAGAMTQLQTLAGTLNSIAKTAGGVSQNVQQSLTNLTDVSGNLAAEINQRVAALQGSGVCDLPASQFLGPVASNIQRYVSLLDAYEAAVNSALDTYEQYLRTYSAPPAVPGGAQLVGDVIAEIESAERYITEFAEYIEQLADPQTVEPVLTEWGARVSTPTQVIGEFNAWIAMQEESGIGLIGQGGSNLISNLRQEIRAPFEIALNGLQGQITAQVTAALAGANLGESVPSLSAEELRREFVRLLMQSQGAGEILRAFNEHLAELLDELDGLTLSVTGQLNVAVKEVIERVEKKVNEALAVATAQIEGLSGGLIAGSMDGFAVIRGNEMHRAHVEAEFAVPGSDADTGWGFNAALDLESWNANGKAEGCSSGKGASLLDATISTRDLPFSFGGDSIVANQIALRFTLQENLAPVALGGLVDTTGTINFQAFELFDLAAASGFGLTENYIGARAGASVSSVTAQAAFLAGKTCNLDVLTALDPEAASFIGLSDRFVGGFSRMSADIPIYDNGCALSVSARADVGAWALFHGTPTIGGVLGGGAFGRAACIAAIRGQITTYGQMSGGEFVFKGEGFGVAGAGLDCDPKTWTNVKRSRRDDWCGTGDAQFSATYRNGWDVGSPKVSAVH